MKSIVFVHGFGSNKTANGLFTDIATLFSEYNTVYCDLNSYDERSTIVIGVNQQARILQDTVSNINSSGTLLICHSFGAVVAAYANLPVMNAFFLAPALSFDIERTITRYKHKPGAHIAMDSVSILPRTDGSITKVLPEFWATRQSIDAVSVIKKYTDTTSLHIFSAEKDEVLLPTTDPKLDSITTSIKDADHNFTGASRANLMSAIKLQIEEYPI